MSEDTKTGEKPAEGTTTPAATPTPPAKVAAKAVEDPAVSEPEFLKDRLDRERRSILKDLGIKLKRGEDPQERIDEYRAELDSDRASAKDLRKKVADHEATIEKLSVAEAAVKVFADMEFNSLSEPQKAIVKAAAGDDPNERLKTIAIMKASAPPVPAKAADAPIPAPAQTAPTSPAPAPGSSQPTDVRAEYQRLRSDPKNGLLAAAYLLQNRDAYYKQPT